MATAVAVAAARGGAGEEERVAAMETRPGGRR